MKFHRFKKCVFFKYAITAHVLYSNHVVYCNLFCVRFLRGTSKVLMYFFHNFRANKIVMLAILKV